MQERQILSFYKTTFLDIVISTDMTGILCFSHMSKRIPKHCKGW